MLKALCKKLKKKDGFLQKLIISDSKQNKEIKWNPVGALFGV